MDDLRNQYEFPTIYWDFMGRWATFFPGESIPSDASIRAVVIFAWYRIGFVLANIIGRGWCTPSGRVEPGETLTETAARETLEETGAVIEELRLIGLYSFQDDDGKPLTVPAYLGIVSTGEEIPAGSESLGSRLVMRSELPEVYFRWDELLEKVFEYAESVARKTWPAAG